MALTRPEISLVARRCLPVCAPRPPQRQSRALFGHALLQWRHSGQQVGLVGDFFDELTMPPIGWRVGLCRHLRHTRVSCDIT
jgi:hypothetical protein